MNNDAVQQALSVRRSVRTFSDKPLKLELVKRLVWAAQGITRDTGLRTAPSAHGLHPLRLYVAAGNVEGLTKGLHHVDEQTGELRWRGSPDILSRLRKAAVDDQKWITDTACVISICADFVTPCRNFADQKPYGRRGSRYVYIEAGAAAQNVALQAIALGVGSILVAGFDDGATAECLGLSPWIEPVLHICAGFEERSF